MLTVLESTPRPPSLRTNWTPQRLFTVLKRIGRFEQLGLSDSQGKILVDAFFARVETGRTAPAVPRIWAT